MRRAALWWLPPLIENRIVPSLHPLGREECIRLLGTHSVGRLGFVANGLPQILPVNYVLSPRAVVIRTAPGMKLEALGRGRVCAFEIDHTDVAYHAGWSVLVHGLATEVDDPRELEAVSDLPLRPWGPGRKDHYMRIELDKVTGRRIEPAAPMPFDGASDMSIG
jgi:nitroimidazol reductase NimA-like FMN-containing flavoprotein (pyridoxamine 5'-phosphate oxidase superfamily)